MRILITGAAGFIGRHLVEHFADTGAQLTLVDTALPGNGSVERFVNEFDGPRFHQVYHCAAFVGGRAGIDGRPAFVHTYDTALDALMFTWALANKPGRFCYFSSSAAYPADIQDGKVQSPMAEAEIDPLFQCAPEATYGLVKLNGEQMARSCAAEFPVTVLRPFSGYGEDQALDYPFPSFIDRARRREDPFEVWGSGEQVRDWIHVDDVVGATVAAMELGVDGPTNLCTGVSTTLNDLARLCITQAGYDAEVRHLDKGRSNGVDYRVGDPSKLHEFYSPKITIAEGVERALRRSPR